MYFKKNPFSRNLHNLTVWCIIWLCVIRLDI